MIICGESSRTGLGSSTDSRHATAGSAGFPRGKGSAREKIEDSLAFR